MEEGGKEAGGDGGIDGGRARRGGVACTEGLALICEFLKATAETEREKKRGWKRALDDGDGKEKPGGREWGERWRRRRMQRR